MERAVKGDFVRIHSVILKAEERTGNIPEDTKKTDLRMWNKGFLLNDTANIGDEVFIETVIGRKTSGTLVEINPSFNLNYGEYIKETAYIGKSVREDIREDKNNG